MNFESPRRKQIDETEEFKVFSEEMDYLIKFLESFSEHLSYNGPVISFISDKQSYTLNAALIESATQTLRSVKLCCSIGSFSDANTLARKLRDDLVQYVYILNIVRLRKPFFEDDLKTLNIEDSDAFAESFLNLRSNNTLTEDEQAVSAWFGNTVSELTNPVRKKLEFKNYMEVLKQNATISQILISYNLQEYWETLRKNLNNYVHNNGIKFSAQNFVSSDNKSLEIHLKNISIRTSYISSFFLVLLLMVDSSLISSTDYMDHLDCGAQPPEGCQYYIASFIQDFIDTKVTKLHPTLKQYLKDNNIHGMKIE